MKRRVDSEPVERKVRIVRKDGVSVAVLVEPREPLRNETVRETAASLRHRHDQ